MGDTPDSIADWHRKFAVDLFNHTWDLLDSGSRNEDDDLDMLASALASLHHWRQVGEPKNLGVSDQRLPAGFETGKLIFSKAIEKGRRRCRT